MHRRSSKIDKKYFVFGEQPEEGEDLHLMGRITGVLRETLDGLLTASEVSSIFHSYEHFQMISNLFMHHVSR